MTNGESLEGRAKRLTPREWRVVALVIEGVSTEEACEALGIAPGTYESHKQAVRRKLAVPRGHRLELFLRENLGALPVPPDLEREVAPTPEAPEREAAAPSEAAERRLRWLLRITLKELSEVAGSAALRAELLEQTVRRVGSKDLAEAQWEVEQLKAVAQEISDTYRRLVEKARSAAPPDENR